MEPIKKIDNNKGPRRSQTIRKRYIRHCPNCNYFLYSDNNGKYNCPKCNTPMHFAIICPNCGLWYDVKTSKKYICPNCGGLMGQ
ncbi:MAG: YfgJ family double zinc ribbon protein [Promethearchaeota archaeon]